MSTSETSSSRPTYVYLLALTALLLFGANFAVSMADRSCEARDIVHHAHHEILVRPVVPAPPSPPPVPDVAELTRELKRAHVEIQRAEKELRASIAKTPVATSVVVVN